MRKILIISFSVVVIVVTIIGIYKVTKVYTDNKTAVFEEVQETIIDEENELEEDTNSIVEEENIIIKENEEDDDENKKTKKHTIKKNNFQNELTTNNQLVSSEKKQNIEKNETTPIPENTQNEASKDENDSSSTDKDANNDMISKYVTETSEISGITKERKAPIPVGYTVSEFETENSIADGLVIYQIPKNSTVDWNNNTIILENQSETMNLQENINQYVWIPVDDINDMIMCKQNGKTNTDGETTYCNLSYNDLENKITCITHRYNTQMNLNEINLNEIGLAGRLYNISELNTTKRITVTYNGRAVNKRYSEIKFTPETKNKQIFIADAQSGKCEPNIVSADKTTNYLTEIGINSSEEFLRLLNEDFIEMAKSVAKYKGFYISRYESSKDGESKKNKSVLTAVDGAWYGLYSILRNNSKINVETVKSHMVWRMSI